MSLTTDADFLRHQQYKTDANLAARQEIHRRFSTAKQTLFEVLYPQAQIQAGQAVLDVGCGNGRFWSLLAEDDPADIRVTLLDLSLGMVQTATNFVRPRVKHLESVQASAMNLPLPSAHFDRVVANHLLYHVPDPAQAVAQFKRVLKTDGRLTASMVGPAHMQEMWHLLTEVLGLSVSPRTLRFFPADLDPLLKAEFKHVTYHPVDDNLHVTDPDVVWRYLLSSDVGKLAAQGQADLPPNFNLAELEQPIKHTIQTEIDRQGYYFIRKDTGNFVCY
jgi:ubiquinone/menaquinone biosynthesis C-methylase UbiE